jgi:ribosomal protein L11 methyltransferase
MRMWPALEIQQADDDDLIQAFLIDFNLAAIDDSRYFFHSSDDRAHAATALRAQFPGIDVHPVDVPDEDWAARSQAALRAVTVGALTIAPPWDVPGRLKPAPTDSAPTYVGAGFSQPSTIVIEPSMGFGTGHHATTRLCLAALQQLDLGGRSVLDVGTGSGVLAIAARRLGASGVLAVDDDADAIGAAEANVRLNQESRIALEVADFRSARIGQFDLVIANLTGALLIASADRLESLAIPSGRLILSGFMDHEERQVLRAFGGHALEWRAQEDEWVSLIVPRHVAAGCRTPAGDVLGAPR